MPNGATIVTDKRILVVDDSVEYLEFMKLLLSAEGYTAETATSTANLREYLDTTTPDLIIADVRMPGHEAFAVLDLLEGQEHLEQIPILFCTGAVQEVEERAEALHTPNRDVLLKPFDIQELLDRVHRLCDPAGIART